MATTRPGGPIHTGKGGKPNPGGRGRAPGGQPGTPSAPTLSQRQARALAQTTAGLMGALMQTTSLNPQAAGQLARVLLSQPGIAIDPTGQIKYQGRVYSAQQFANSGLARLYSGQRAAAENQAAIRAQPSYLQAAATLGLNRDQTVAAIQDAERQAEINYGDPAFAHGDPLTAGQAAANPFGLTQLIGQAYTRAQQATRQAANDAGTLYGGGYSSGQAEDARLHAQQVSNAVAAIQKQLGGYNQQLAGAQQGYNTGIENALIQAQQNLLKSGAWNAATRPQWTMGSGATYYGFTHPHPSVGGATGPASGGHPGAGPGANTSPDPYGNYTRPGVAPPPPPLPGYGNYGR